MINNSININKINNHLLPQIIEHKKKDHGLIMALEIQCSNGTDLMLNNMHKYDVSVI
jgi:hypothetical protein